MDIFTRDYCSQELQPLDPEIRKVLHKIANTVRGLSIDAVEKANSGHPGMPLGCADLAAYLWGVAMRFNPKDPHWPNRDRFVLSNGHGSMMLYSILHLSGYDLSMEEIKNFRQLHSKTPGHPECLDTPGVETTTGPLGQGVGNAVGLALGMKMLAAKFNTEDCKLFDNKVFVMLGDGCVMEGVASEASSFAGHLNLNNLIGIYDANQISLDGPLPQSCSENVKQRYEAYGWDVVEVDGHNIDAIHQVLHPVICNQKRPTLVVAHTVIGKGSPNKANTHQVHGAPLGADELKATKEVLGIPLEPFYVPQSVYEFFKHRQSVLQNKEKEWKERLEHYSRKYPEKYALYQTMAAQKCPDNIEEIVNGVPIKSPVAGRKASQAVIQKLAEILPYLYGGSADLSCSDLTMMEKFPLILPDRFEGRNIKFGVREFGMATIANGLAKTEFIVPFIGTFLTFSDYMRNAIRLCALMKEHVIYQFTHDSIFLGEDGPTHQPVEHFAALRAIPNLHVIRPADANEVRMAWIAALRYQGPTALILSRQNLPEISGTKVPYSEGLSKGAYIVRKETRKPDYTLVATGSELSLAMDVAEELSKRGKETRVISMPCWELFEAQSREYRDSIFGGDLGRRVSIEAGVDQGWHKYIGREGIAICMESFGMSAPYKELATEFGFTVESILERIL